jgi:type IV secretion system protein VirB10
MFEKIREYPTDIKKINKKLIVTVVGAALLLIVVFFGVNSEKKRNFANAQKTGVTAQDQNTNAEFLNGLPKDYAFLQNMNTGGPKKAPLTSPRPESISGSPSDLPPQNPALPEAPPPLAAAPAPIPQGPPDPTYSQKSTIFFADNNNGARQIENQNLQIQPVAAGLNPNNGLNPEMATLAGVGQPNLNSQEKQQKYFDQKTGANNTSIYNSHTVEDPISPYHVLAGSILPATLITGLNSDLPGEVIAQVRENIYDTTTGKTLLIPQGTKIIGTYDNQINWGQERVMQIWSRLIFPDGSSMVLDGNSGADLAGNSGLGDKVNNHYGKLAGAVLLSAFLSVGTEWSAGDVNGYNPDRKQEVAEDVGSDFNRSGQKIVERQLNVAPTIQVRPGFRFVVMVNRDLILRPYKTL